MTEAEQFRAALVPKVVDAFWDALEQQAEKGDGWFNHVYVDRNMDTYSRQTTSRIHP